MHAANLCSASSAPRLYRLREIIGDPARGIPGILPISRSAWYKGIKDGRYPKPLKISTRISVWRSTDIQALVDRLTAKGGDA